MVASDGELPAVSTSAVKSLEAGNRPRHEVAIRCCAETIGRAMAGTLFPAAGPGLTSKLEKPDTAQGWDSVRSYATQGVPLPTFLHQRHYGGAFRQLLDATSTRRGDLLEDAVELLLADAGVPFIRTGSHNQAEIETRFGVTVRPAPDFVFFDDSDTLRGLLESKGANDGGTARDKASRFRSLREEAARLGGVPLFAMLGGLGWTRVGDALGPVVRDTDGRVFTLATLADILSVDPLPTLIGSGPPSR